jgi:hypothetical protein
MARSESVSAGDESERRTVIMRVSNSLDTTSLLSEITAEGSTVISDGVGVIVIEGSAKAIENLRQHKYVIAIDEPRQMQMRHPSMTFSNKETEGGS